MSTEVPNQPNDLTADKEPMSAPQKPIRKRPSPFALALGSALLVPVVAAVFFAVMLAIGNNMGPEGLGPVVLGLTVLVFSFPFAGVLLIIIAIIAAIARRQLSTAEDGSQRAARTERVGYISTAVLAVAPLAIGLLMVLSILLQSLASGAISHVTAPNQNEDKVKQTMETSLNDMGYTTLPGYAKAGSAITMIEDKNEYGVTTHSASVFLGYSDAKAITEAKRRLIAKGWDCRSSATAPVAQAEALAATGSKTPNISCAKSGREVLNFTYVSPKRVILEATTDGKQEATAAPTDAKWCGKYTDDQSGEVAKSCRATLGRETPEELALKYGMSKECYDQVGKGAAFSSSTKVTKRCVDELRESQERFKEDRASQSASSGSDRYQY